MVESTGSRKLAAILMADVVESGRGSGSGNESANRYNRGGNGAGMMGYMRMLTWFALLGGVTIALMAGCHTNPYYDPSRPHHTEDGFKNNYPHDAKPGLWALIGVLIERWWDEPPETAQPWPPPHPPADLVALMERRDNPSITWIGHATLLIQMGGLNIITDPQFSDRASPFNWMGPKRIVPPAIALEKLPHIDVVVISHNHYDHLDEDTLVALAAQLGGAPRFFVPLGLKPWFADLGIDTVEEMDWWDTVRHHGLAIHSVPVQHWSARTRFDTNETLWSGWVLDDGEFRFFFAGDTGYSADFADIGRRLGPFDLAAIPIGAYEPRWFMKVMHVNPEEAVRIHGDLRARYSVGIHWGTFSLSTEALDEPPRLLALALEEADIPPERFFVLSFGETRAMEPLLKQVATE